MSELRPHQFETTEYYAPQAQAEDGLDGPFHSHQPAQPSHIVKDHDRIDQLHLPSALHPWHVPSKPSKEPSQKNKVEKYYYEAWMSGFGRWLCSLVVIGLAAWVIYEVDETPVLEATAANLACAGLHAFIFGPYVRSRSPTDAKPPKWYLHILSASTVLWAAAFACMIAVVTIQDPYNLSAYRKRSKGRISASVFGAGENIQYITIALTAFGGMTFFCCLLQWYYIARLLRGSFSEGDIRKAYVKASKDAVPEQEQPRELEEISPEVRYS